MRWVSKIPHDALQINVYATEHRFVIKFEAGPMEQTYKFKKEVVSSLPEVEDLVQQVLLDRVMQHFDAMFQTIKASVEYRKQS